MLCLCNLLCVSHEPLLTSDSQALSFISSSVTTFASILLHPPISLWIPRPSSPFQQQWLVVFSPCPILDQSVHFSLLYILPPIIFPSSAHFSCLLCGCQRVSRYWVSFVPTALMHLAGGPPPCSQDTPASVQLRQEEEDVWSACCLVSPSSPSPVYSQLHNLIFFLSSLAIRWRNISCYAGFRGEALILLKTELFLIFYLCSRFFHTA